MFLHPKLFSNTEPNVNSCEIFDDIWIKIGNQVYAGFIYGKTRRRLLVTYYDSKKECFVDEWFITANLQDNTKIQKNNLTLYFNKPCFTD